MRLLRLIRYRNMRLCTKSAMINAMTTRREIVSMCRANVRRIIHNQRGNKFQLFTRRNTFARPPCAAIFHTFYIFLFFFHSDSAINLTVRPVQLLRELDRILASIYDLAARRATILVSFY